MKSKVFRAVLVVVLLFAFGCVSKSGLLERPKESPNYPLTMSAWKQYTKMLDAGLLPGMAKGEHGRLKSSSFYLGDPVSYPVERTFTVEKEGDSEFTYSYTFSKQSKEADWKLIHAWKTDKEGNKEELPIQQEG